MKKVAIVLSGSGYLDGSEIHETICSLLALTNLGATYEGLAPDRPQYDVINHRTESPQSGETRHILTEAARIVRGRIKPLAYADINEYDAIIFPGGFGAAKNLFNFSQKGKDYKVAEDVRTFIENAIAAQKPIGYICISPLIIPHLYPKGTKMTIGNDPELAEMVTNLGAEHINCQVDDIVVDERASIVSTPAYMLGKEINDVAVGITKLVQKLLTF